MQQQTILFLGLSSTLAAVVSGKLLLGDVQQPESSVQSQRPAAMAQQPQSSDPFMREYQELERLLEETRAQRKQQQIALAERMGVAPIEEPEPMLGPSEPAEIETPLEAEVPATVEPVEVVPEPEKVVAEPQQPEPVDVVKKQEEAPPEAKQVKAPVEPEKPREVAVEPPPVESKPAPEPTKVAEAPKPVAPVEQEAAKPKAPEPQQMVKREEPKPAKVASTQPLPVKQEPPKEVVKEAAPKAAAVKPPKVKQPESVVAKKKPAPKKRRGISGNHIQMATFTSRKRAQRVVDDLRDAKFNAEVVAVTSRGKRYYLVRDYSPQNKKAALELKKIYDEWLKVDSLVRY